MCHSTCFKLIRSGITLALSGLFKVIQYLEVLVNRLLRAKQRQLSNMSATFHERRLELFR